MPRVYVLEHRRTPTVEQNHPSASIQHVRLNDCPATQHALGEVCRVFQILPFFQFGVCRGAELPSDPQHFWIGTNRAPDKRRLASWAPGA